MDLWENSPARLEDTDSHTEEIAAKAIEISIPNHAKNGEDN
jgi:hypothetical protein